jgi:hypothetical protein
VLLCGINHVAILTSDADRRHAFFRQGHETFEEIRSRLMERGPADAFVTDFGQELSLFFRDPDGLEGEVLVRNPDAKPGVHNPPGTPAARYVQS